MEHITEKDGGQCYYCERQGKGTRASYVVHDKRGCLRCCDAHAGARHHEDDEPVYTRSTRLDADPVTITVGHLRAARAACKESGT